MINMGIEKLVRKFCVQTAVYWGNPLPDGYGKLSFDPPVEISCRWEDTTKVVTGANGEQIVCRAIILVTQDLDEGGMLYLGALDDISSTQETNPYLISNAYSIKRFDKVPAVKSTTEFVRTAYL
jgi:hypothetical protein